MVVSVMGSSMQVEFLKVLACVAWADEEVTNAELNFIKQFVRQFHLTGEEWAQVEMYLDEKIAVEEMRRVTQRFLSRVRRPRERQMLVDAVEQLLKSDEKLTDSEREWMSDLRRVVSGDKGRAFFLDGLKSLLRIGGKSRASPHVSSKDGRDAEFHDFIHNRVLFKLRRRLGPDQLEKEGSPEKLRKLTLSAALLGRVGYVDNEFLPQEEAFMKKVLCETWGASPPMAGAVSKVAMETVSQRVDLSRLIQEVKATMTMAERKQLLEGMFAMSKAEGKMSNEEIEEIRKVAYGLDFTHRQFINAKLKVLKG